MVENIKALKFDFSKKLLTVFVHDGDKLRKLEIVKYDAVSPNTPPITWPSMVEGEIEYQRSVELMASEGGLIPGYNS